jgi:hypothetical protein
MALFSQTDTKFKTEIRDTDFTDYPGLNFYGLRPDFYLPDFKLFVEADGSVHVHDGETKLTKRANFSQSCLDNGLKLIEIPLVGSLDKFQNAVIASGLLELIDINKNQIDWKKVVDIASTQTYSSIWNEYNRLINEEGKSKEAAVNTLILNPEFGYYRDAQLKKILALGAELERCCYARNLSSKWTPTLVNGSEIITFSSLTELISFLEETVPEWSGNQFHPVTRSRKLIELAQNEQPKIDTSGYLLYLERHLAKG